MDWEKEFVTTAKACKGKRTVCIGRTHVFFIFLNVY